MMLLLAGLGVVATIGVALAVAGTVALGPLFWVPYLLVYLAARAFGLDTRFRSTS